jgi:hypothetical protein
MSNPTLCALQKLQSFSDHQNIPSTDIYSESAAERNFRRTKQAGLPSTIAIIDSDFFLKLGHRVLKKHQLYVVS